MTDSSSNVNVMDEDELKKIIVHETLLENISTDKSESERNIVKETWLQNNSANVSEYASSETIMELNKKEYKEPSVTK